MDIYTKEKRSKIMANIKGKESKPEIVVRKYLFSKGFRYRVNDKRYSGKPDIVIARYNTIIFIHGCFWHGHESCKASKLPDTNRDFWENKILKNKERDQKIIENLKKEGWKVIVIWQCEINTKSKRDKRMDSLVNEICN